ncbi:DNA helicase MCM8 [Zancudomyces culisetae]|uniref:DNA helicase MCM8 n=1 Tax=Zancudomyces culisetae TaxID=1213189 RepID=A0A1R1PHM9_ZANCU|nr:DNA helicase MCM8 [Zancudomyces culisetae]|eukprot:OMH80480.1 DNA helicase MCM8 [Zancudomyces culisetae]
MPNRCLGTILDLDEGGGGGGGGGELASGGGSGSCKSRMFDLDEEGRIPKSINVELTHEMTEGIVPGDTVQVTGILKTMSADDGGGGGGRRQRQNSMFNMYIDAVSIAKVGESTSGGAGVGEYTTMDREIITSQFTNSDLEFIEEVRKQPNIFRLLVQSFCPSIFGNELVKAGLLLGIFGGSNKFNDGSGVGAVEINTSNNDDGNNEANGAADGVAKSRSGNTGGKGELKIRNNSHILVVGDPGLGKSQMLTFASGISPRGVYVCGTSGISSTGLTVTLVKEAGTSDFALEAGALVLSDMGCCCIDEFDKLVSNHEALLEAMEQQSVSIAKGGIVCTLPARVSVLAAANPVGGHYNKSKTVSENLKMNSALLSRFDLIFILLDKPNANKDKYLSEHVMALHSGVSKRDRRHWGEQRRGNNGRAIGDTNLNTQLSLQSSNEPSYGNSRNGETLLEMLQGTQSDNYDDYTDGSTKEQQLDLIPKHLLKIYIAYARKHVHPTLSHEAKLKLKDFYLKLRDKQAEFGAGNAIITTRQLEALVRLGEARARLELRDTVTATDVDQVIEIMENSLLQTNEQKQTA